MLLEFSGGRQVSYRVNPRHGGTVERVSEVYAPDYFKELAGDDQTLADAATHRRSSASSGAATAAPSRQLQRRVRAALERIFLPAGYPNSVTDDLLTFALWDAAQVLATSVMSALSVRAVLLGVGVGESGANLTSSTLSWMLRDGTWLVGSIFFASIISQDLEYRAKSWRLVADVTNDAATFLELCAPLLPGGQLTFRLIVALASVIKALVGVCGGGTRASFTQHFALRGNAADVAAKAGTRGNVGSLIGLALGMVVAYVVPATSSVLNLTVFVLSTTFHLFANYRGVRAVQLRHLNAPRLEWCVEHFLHFQAEALVAQKKEATAAAAPVLDISIHRANAQERLFVLPALPTVPAAHGGMMNRAYRLLRHYARSFSLRVCVHCGASLFRLLSAQTDLSAAQKQALVQRVEESLSTRGIALLFDETTESYSMILPEFYTVEGVPESWVRYKRQWEEGRRTEKATHRARAAQRRKAAHTTSDASAVVAEEEAEEETYRSAAEVADAEAQAEMERLRKERVVVPPHVLPMAYRELWAYFYAYVHHRAVGERRDRTAQAKSNAAPAASAPAAAAAAAHERLQVITHLCADGRVGEAQDTAWTMVDPMFFDEVTSPTSTTSSKARVFPNGAASGAAGSGLTIAPQDGLFSLFLDFVRALRKTGWELDRLLIDNEGYTTVVHYL